MFSSGDNNSYRITLVILIIAVLLVALVVGYANQRFNLFRSSLVKPAEDQNPTIDPVERQRIEDSLRPPEPVDEMTEEERQAVINSLPVPPPFQDLSDKEKENLIRNLR